MTHVPGRSTSSASAAPGRQAGAEKRSATTPDRGARLVFVGNHPPRQCGIATFTADLSGAVRALAPELGGQVVAMNDPGRRYLYPEQVCLEVAEATVGSYRIAADFLNRGEVGVVSLQHEYGIFGGGAGAHLLVLLRELRMPVVTTLHTILAEPSPAQRLVMDEICARSQRLVVMSDEGVELLDRVHQVDPGRVDVIPHGIPVLPTAQDSKVVLGVAGRPVLLTFGLLSPDKGIEYVIDALPAIAARYPEVLYVVLGATHPHVQQQHGESYRTMLEARGHRLGIGANLVFHDRFVSDAELARFVAAADIYITPYLDSDQITSGTLAYAVGTGKAVVSSPYPYARELLADGRGVLVPWRDAPAIAGAVIGLLADPGRRAAIEERAARFGQAMGWPVVARCYLDTFHRAIEEHTRRRSPRRSGPVLVDQPVALPAVDLGHLRTLTDDTGVLQHAAWCVPRREDGYCLDDNARALLLVTLVEEAGLEPPARIAPLASCYLAFVRHAFQVPTGRFRNFLGYGRQWLEPCGSEDSHGRALWALGTVIARSDDPGRRGLATEIFDAALPAARGFSSPRSWAYTLLGLAERVAVTGFGEAVVSAGRDLARRLLDRFERSSHADWPWFEDRLTYANARLPEALLQSGAWQDDAAMIDTGLRTLEWLSVTQRADSGVFAPIGSNGFFVRGGSKAEFDQQPIEACGMVTACLAAHDLTGEPVWVARARRAFAWYVGHNQLGESLLDPRTGGCRDGLHPERANQNQGAESTLSFLMALVAMRSVEGRALVPVDDAPPGSARDLGVTA